MSKYYGLIIPRSYNDYFRRDEPQAIKEILRMGTDAELDDSSENPVQNKVLARIIPADATADNKLATSQVIDDMQQDIEAAQEKITTIEGFMPSGVSSSDKLVKNSTVTAISNKIPNAASASNQLADKAFVNSTVATNTAVFRGTFNSLELLRAYSGTKTNNDYAFVVTTDTAGNTKYERYKYNGSSWVYEYTLNNSSFTAEQWAAIQSGITAEKVAQFERGGSLVDVVQSGNMSAVTSNAVANKVNGGLCSTAKTTAAKSVSIDNFVLKVGVIVGVIFTNGNSAANPTLNVNGTGAKPIKATFGGAKITPAVHSGKWRGESSYTNEMWQAYTTLELMYDGQDWVIMGNPLFESWVSSTGNSDYSVYANGLIEQRGEASISSYTATITFYVKMYTRLHLIFTPNDNTDHSDSRYGYYNDTENGFNAKSYGAKGKWYAIGQ